MKTLIRSLALVAALVLSGSSAFAQTALTTTTLGAALDNSSLTLSVASATGITAPGTGATFVYLLVDRELLEVRAVNGLQVTVGRGRSGTRSVSHVTASVVTIVQPNAIVNYQPTGQCVRSTLPYVPLVAVGVAVPAAFNGNTYDCLGVTTAGQFVQTNDNGIQVVGSTMASVNGVLGAFTGTILTVSGANAITGFTNPAGLQPGFVISLVPSGTFTWTAAGNIAIAGTAVVNKLLQFMWNGSKWIPNYIA